MRNAHTLILSSALSVLSLAAMAQRSDGYEVIKQKYREIPYMQKQIDSMQKKYEKDGFTVVMRTPVSMENAYDMPVLFPLRQGTFYQFVYIGEYESKTYEVRLSDWEEHLAVKQRKMWGNVDGNIIEFAYKPQVTEKYVATLFQYDPKKKAETLYGYFMIMERTGNVPAQLASNLPASKPVPPASPSKPKDFFDKVLSGQ